MNLAAPLQNSNRPSKSISLACRHIKQADFLLARYSESAQVSVDRNRQVDVNWRLDYWQSEQN